MIVERLALPARCSRHKEPRPRSFLKNLGAMGKDAVKEIEKGVATMTTEASSPK